MSITPVNILFVTLAAAFLCNCSRDLDQFENPMSVEKQTGGALCKTAKVMLMNKEELSRYIEADNFRYLINSSEECLYVFATSIYGDNTKLCKINTTACTIKKDGKYIAIFWRNANQIELNIWS